MKKLLAIVVLGLFLNSCMQGDFYDQTADVALSFIWFGIILAVAAFIGYTIHINGGLRKTTKLYKSEIKKNKRSKKKK